MHFFIHPFPHTSIYYNLNYPLFAESLDKILQTHLIQEGRDIRLSQRAVKVWTKF